MSGSDHLKRAGRRAGSLLLGLALSAFFCAAAFGEKEPPENSSYKEATLVVPVQAEGTPLRAATDPVEFRSIRMRFKEVGGGKRRVRLIIHLANTGRADYTARVEAAFVNDSGEALASGGASAEVEPGEPGMIEMEITVSEEILDRTTGCRLKLAVWRS